MTCAVLAQIAIGAVVIAAVVRFLDNGGRGYFQ